MKTVPDLAEARARTILAPYVEALAQAIERAWEKWLTMPPDHRMPLGPRSRATNVYDYICHEIRHRFTGLPGTHIEERRTMLLLHIEGVIILRFKKLNNSLMGSNVRTRFQTEFTAQLQLPDLPPEAARVVVGYRLDPSQSKITNILVTYRVGDEVKWSFPIREDVDAIKPIPVSLPFPVPSEPTRKVRVKAKAKRQEQPQSDEGAGDADQNNRETSGS